MGLKTKNGEEFVTRMGLKTKNREEGDPDYDSKYNL